jgi:hypothetical protein
MIVRFDRRCGVGAVLFDCSCAIAPMRVGFLVYRRAHDGDRLTVHLSAEWALLASRMHANSDLLRALDDESFYFKPLILLGHLRDR